MRLLISQHNLGKWAAHYIYKKIQSFKPTESKPFVLGLPTGSTPLEMYKELISLYKQKLLSFKHVITFNMDEYVGLPEEHDQSYHYYMYNNFFNHIDIPKKNINILNGNARSLEYECQEFEKKLTSLGSMELIIGGVGNDGHIAFNEPGSSLTSVTRIKTLNHSTILANSRFFNDNITNTPTVALTMGIKTILTAKDILVLARGANKALAVAQAVESGVSSMCPISALQFHGKSAIICDEYAAYELKLKTVRYFEDMKDEYSDMDAKLDLNKLV